MKEMKSLMLFAPLLLLLVSAIGELTRAANEDQNECGGSSVKYCGESGENPAVQFPFRLLLLKDNKQQHHQTQPQAPKHCSGTGFDLTCKDGITIFQLPTSTAQFRVHDINYGFNTITLSKYPPESNCLANIFLALDFSSSFSAPFRYAVPYDFEAPKFTFINCSHSVTTSSYSSFIYPVKCLSDAQHLVYVVRSSELRSVLPEGYCQTTRTIRAPSPEDIRRSYLYRHLYSYEDRFQCGPTLQFQYYVGTHNLNLYSCNATVDLWWTAEALPQCSKCLNRGQRCGFKNITTGEWGCLLDPPLPPNYGPHFPFADADAKDARTKHVIIGVTTATGFSVLIIAAIICIWLYRSRELARRKDKENEAKVEKFLEDYKSLKPTRYSYAEIKKMTSQFETKLGEGGFGSVFKGKLLNGTLVAVKILKDTVANHGDDFINEVGTIGRVHHVNVVRLLGYCADRFKRALIYEFMPNESLEKFIFRDQQNHPNDHSHNINHHQLMELNYRSLGWKKVREIAIGIARGIEYLHQGCNQRILHFDIKPHNILLDHNLNPKISDFGFAKLCAQGQSTVSMTAARGTMGYIAPEVFSRNFGFNVSYKSDVYSFGMLLLEMVGGRKNIDPTAQHSSQVYFPEWIYNRLDQSHGGEDLIATGLDTASEDAKIAKRLVIVATWCIQWYPSSRPCMKTVVQILEGSSDDLESLPIPPNPFGSTTQPHPKQTTSSTLTLITE